MTSSRRRISLTVLFRQATAGVLSGALLLVSLPPATAFGAAGVGAVWANEGGDKVTQDELRATTNAAGVVNSVWDGTRVKLFGAKNEVVNFNLILEAPSGASSVRVAFDTLTGPNGRTIT